MSRRRSPLARWSPGPISLSSFSLPFLGQFLLLAMLAVIATRGSLEVLDRATFDPTAWRSGIAADAGFQIRLGHRARHFDNPGFVCPDYRFRYRNDFAGDGALGEEFIAWVRRSGGSRNSEIVVGRRPYTDELPEMGEEDACAGEAQAVARFGDSLQGQVDEPRAIVTSRLNGLSGLRRLTVNDLNVHELCADMGCKEDAYALRWVQAIIDSATSSARASTLLSGPIQGLMFVFFYMTLLLVFVEFRVTRRSDRSSRDRSIVPLLARRESHVRLQQLVNRIRGLRLRRKMTEEMVPDVTLDLVEPGYKTLLNYTGEVNPVEVQTILDSTSQTLLEKTACRFQIMRYFVVSIPSLGFIGTVLGIGRALSATGVMMSEATAAERLLANQYLSGNLYVAFDTTLVGLVTSIVLGFIVDLLETREVNFVLETRKKMMENLGNVREMLSERAAA